MRRSIACSAPPNDILNSGASPVAPFLNDERRFQFSGSRPQLGPFEQQLLQELWSHGSATVRELLADGKIRQAYTTVMTTMDRLYKKGLLDRVAEGRAFRYTPRHTPEEMQRARRWRASGNCWDRAMLPRCRFRIWWKRSARTTRNCSMSCNF